VSLYLYSQVPPRSFIDRGAGTAIYRRCEFTAGARKVSAPIAIPSLRFSFVILLSSSSTMDVRSPRSMDQDWAAPALRLRPGSR